MKCRDVRAVTDALVSGELPAETETNDQLQQHLQSCPSCRADIEDRRRLRAGLRAAFNRAPSLQSSPEFRERLREHLRHAAAGRRRFPGWALSWLVLAAGVVLAAGLSVSFLFLRSSGTDDAQAHDAIGDHRNCALHYRLVRHPVPLDEAAQRFDQAYRVLANAPPNEISTPGGTARVIDRHSCEYGAHRFGHVILQYGDRVISLLVTANAPSSAARAVDPHVIGRPFEGLTVVSVNGARHAVMLVGDLHERELTQLARIVSVPLVQQLASGPYEPNLTATLFVPALQPE
jgi:hypothetical protein